MYKSLRYIRLFLVVLALVFFILAAITNRKYIEGDVILFYILIPSILVHFFVFFISIILLKKARIARFNMILLSITIFIQLILNYFIFRAINF